MYMLLSSPMAMLCQRHRDRRNELPLKRLKEGRKEGRTDTIGTSTCHDILTGDLSVFFFGFCFEKNFHRPCVTYGKSENHMH